ncbi:hypothetical protein BB560_005664, partial [Smittium megazygosporum]
MSEIIEEYKFKPLMKPVDRRPLAERINWVNLAFVPAMPIIAIYGLFNIEMKSYTIIFAALFGVFSGLGITAGYHRLWSHTSYKATLPLQIILLIAGTASVQESVIRWSRHHRAHHRYTDTPLDPYNAHKGFIYTHMGWLFYKRERSDVGYVGVSDLKANKLLMLQHRTFYPLAFIFSFLIPTVICGLGWGDWAGGLFFASIGRLAIIHELTFCINSITHIFGSSTFGNEQTPKDSTLVGLATFGEGYHNFHHEFPRDYGASTFFFKLDITKWFIDLMAFFGLAYDLNTTPEDQIKMIYIQTRLKELDINKSLLDFAIPLK